MDNPSLRTHNIGQPCVHRQIAEKQVVFWKELLQLRNSGQQDAATRAQCAFDPCLN